MGLRDRMRRLEQRASSGCPECDRLPGEADRIIVMKEEERPEQEYCPRCGRPLLVIIQVVQDD